MLRINEDGDLEQMCSKCHEWWYFSPEFFHITGSHRNPKLHTWCKDCMNTARRERYQNEKEAVKWDGVALSAANV